MHGSARTALIVAVVSLVGCSGASPGVGEAHQALTATNGNGLNGNGLNGNGLNGNGLNGSALGSQVVSVDLAGATLEGLSLDPVTLSGSQLIGTAAGVTYAGTALVGAQFQGTTDTGNPVTLRIAQASLEAPPNTDTWDYWVDYRDPGTQAWSPLCADGTGTAQPAYALQGYWSYAFGSAGGGGKVADSTRFDFACKNSGAIGKCVAFGYAPWRTLSNGVSLDRTHQACVRMVRADFCGDGTSYTQDGRQIDLYDWAGIQFDTEPWVTEAEWDENGARCFYSENRSSMPVPCYDPTKAFDCGDLSHFGNGTLLIDEIPAS